MNATAARKQARAELEIIRRIQLKYRILDGDKISDAEARAAGFRDAAQAMKRFNK